LLAWGQPQGELPGVADQPVVAVVLSLAV